jgi:hypothetical protein
MVHRLSTAHLVAGVEALDVVCQQLPANGTQEAILSNDHAQLLFVVGSPRSGTTLLRNLLHGHQEVALTAYESHFVPVALQHYGAHPNVGTLLEDSTFLRRFKRGLLYQKGREHGVFCPTDTELRAAINESSWAVVLRNLFDLYCDKDMSQAQIWGDKTPAYVDHIDLIDKALPDARFVHIIRDPRDQALSERAIWGKSLRRSAETWRRRIANARASRAAAEGRYIELTYEGLVNDPERELRRLSSWLRIDFQPSMLSSYTGSDELGQMVGAQSISNAAIGGRRRNLSTSDEILVASLTGDIGRSLAYDLPSATPRHLRRAELSVLAVHDRLALIAYFVRRKGLIDGMRFTIGSLIDARKP